MKLTQRIILSLALTWGIGIVNGGSASAQDSFFDSSGADVIITYADWTTNYEPAEPLETKEPFAGTLWDTYAFHRTSDYMTPSTGYMDFPIVGTITSRNKVDKIYRRAAVHVSFSNTAWRDLYTHSLGMDISSSNDFSNSTSCVVTRMLSAQGEYYLFDIPETSDTQYFRFNFDVAAGGPKDAWVGAYEILLYESPDYLSIDFNESERSCKFLSKKGELHIKMTEFDSEGNPTELSPSYLIKEEAWTNRVADQGEPYIVYAPSEEGHYLEIIAKSVYNGEHSAEKFVRLSQEGMSSGIINNSLIKPQSAELIEWYDLTGRRLTVPSRGPVIKKEGSKAILIIK